jgi:integrase
VEACCSRGQLDPSVCARARYVERHSNIVNRGWHPAQVAAGVTKGGKAKFAGLHSLRHLFASWRINRKAHGG